MIANHIRAAGIGVSNLAASHSFYVDVVGLVHRGRQESSLGHDDVLVDPRGNQLLLTSYAREHNYKKNPVKLVFAVPGLDASYERLMAAGARKHTPPRKFGDMYLAMVFDPDGYVVEFIELAVPTSPVLVAVGIGVSDLDVAARFYTGVLGMKFVRDIAVPGYMNEKELAPTNERGPSLVLMNYEDKSRSYANVPTRLVLSVEDPVTFASRVAQHDAGKVLSAAAAKQDGIVAGSLRDDDGYVIELRQATDPTSAQA